MSLETEVAALTTASNALLSAVNVSKATLDASTASATGSASTATTQASIASTKAAEADASAVAAAASAASIAGGPVASVNDATGIVTLKTVGGASLVGSGNVSAPTFTTLSVSGNAILGPAVKARSTDGATSAFGIIAEYASANDGICGIYDWKTPQYVMRYIQSTGAVSFESGAVTIPGTLTVGCYICLTANQINEVATNGHGSLAINYNGYNNGTTQFRTTTIYNGKNVPIANFDGTTGTVTIPGNLSLTGGTLGYGTGAGGTVTQATSKSTDITLNKPCGQITMHNAALAAGASVAFQLNNSLIAPSDVVCLSGYWGAVQAASYRIETSQLSNGLANIRVTNITVGSLSEALQINFTIIKAALS